MNKSINLELDVKNGMTGRGYEEHFMQDVGRKFPGRNVIVTFMSPGRIRMAIPLESGDNIADLRGKAGKLPNVSRTCWL
ncbi:MAG TPA: hypothetical protein PLK35_02895 [Candidatus Moranbacteria bacterium]|nr:hypothetical protein [Candidatus Moranbacteria bacterium]